MIMNKFKLKLALVLLLLLSVVTLPVTAFAQTSSREERIVTLNKNQTVNHDYFGAGDQVTINGTVNGDAYIAGGKVDINGTINGDLLVAGGQVTIRGVVAQNIRGAGGNITVLGTVGRNITLAGGNLTIEPSAKITGNAVLAGGNIDILSQVKDLTLAGGNVQVASTVLGNITAGVGRLTVADGADVKGSINYWSEDKANVSNGASVSGQTSFHRTREITTARESSVKAAGILAGLAVFFTIISFLGSLIIGALIIYFLPVYSQKTSALITNNLGTTIIVGLAVLIATPVLAILLMVTLVGFPIAMITLFAYGVMIYLSKIFVAMAIGAYVAKMGKFRLSPFWAFTTGLVLYYILGFIPIIGWLLKLLVLLAGVGAFVMQKKYYFTTLRDKKLI